MIITSRVTLLLKGNSSFSEPTILKLLLSASCHLQLDDLVAQMVDSSPKGSSYPSPHRSLGHLGLVVWNSPSPQPSVLSWPQTFPLCSAPSGTLAL